MTNSDCHACRRTVATDALTAVALLPVEGSYVQTSRPDVLGLLCGPCLSRLLAPVPGLEKGLSR